MMPFTLAYPTPQHAAAAAAVCELLSAQPGIEAVLLAGSCARGKASPDSCLDMIALLKPETKQARGAEIEGFWKEHYPADPVFKNILSVGAYSNVEVDFVDGDFREPYHGYTSGADNFELEIGNTLAYTALLWQRGSYYEDLRARWLPYYSDELRSRRLEMALHFCRNNLNHIPLYAPRRLYFQSFKRLYNAFEEFLQALFIARRAYPIAYDKWVEEGVSEILDLPDLYARLPRLFEIQHFESLEVVDKARALEGLIAEYVEPLR